MEKLLRETLTGGTFKNITPQRSKMMKAVKSKGNKSTELNFCIALSAANVNNWVLHPKIIGNPDIYFPTCHVAVFLDGCFWHGCPQCGHVPKTNNHYWKTKIIRNIERDYQKALALKSEGHVVVRFWEHELHEDITACVMRLQEILDHALFNAVYGGCE